MASPQEEEQGQEEQQLEDQEEEGEGQQGDGEQNGQEEDAGNGEDEQGEGEEDGEEGGDKSPQDSSEEEEEEAGGDDYDMGDGFIATEEGVDEGEDGGDDEASRRRRKKKRAQKKRNLALDEEDYDLLEENQVKVKRPSGRKRLKRAEDQPKEQDAEEMRHELFGSEDLEDEIESEEPPGGKAPKKPPPAAKPVVKKGKSKEKAARKQKEAAPSQQAEPEEVEDAGAADEGQQGYDDGEDMSGDEDEMDDFIVDEEPGAGGRSSQAQARRRRRRALQGAMPGVSGAMMEEAADIFGDVGALMEMYDMARHQKGAGEEGEGEGAERDELYGQEDEEEMDDEAYQRKQKAKEEAQRASMLQKAMRILDAETLAAQHLMPADQVVRERDLPERMQLAGVVMNERTVETEDGQQHVMRDIDLDACADWMYHSMMGQTDRHNEQLRVMRHILRDGILEVDGSMPEPSDKGWHRDNLVDAKPERLPSSKFMHLGGRRAIRKARTKEQLDKWERSPEAQDALRQSIKNVLVHMYEKGEEPCLIGMYRKEQAGELNSHRQIKQQKGKPFGREEKRSLLDPRATDENDYNERHEAFRDARATAFDIGTMMPKHRRMRRFDLLWGVMWQSLRFRKLSRRRDTLRARLDAAITALRATTDDPSAEIEARELEGLVELLQNAWTEPVLNDIDARVRTTKDLRGLELPDVGNLSLGDEGGQRRQASKRGPNSFRGGSSIGTLKILRQIGIENLLREVVLTPQQLMENLHEADTPPHMSEEPSMMPIEWMEYKSQEMPLESGQLDAEGLLLNMKIMAVMEVSSHPGIRAWVRNFYFDNAEVSTQCTPVGVDHPLMEPYAKYGVCRRLRNKPVSTFRGSDLFLRIMQAAQEKLITVTMSVDDVEVSNVVEQISNLYKSANVAATAREWNKVREDIIYQVVNEKLMPQFELETKQRLLAAAKEVALDRYSLAYWKLASQPPLRLRLPEEENLGDPAGEPYVTAPKIMAACWGSGKPNPTVVVALNEHGNLVDLLPCGQLSGRIPRSTPGAEGVFQDPRKQRDIERLRDKIMEKSPHAIVVGTADPNSAQLHSDVVAVCDHLLDYNIQWTKELELQHVQVVQADERLAMLWERCKAAQDEFPEQPAHVRRAIALGRLQIDPLPVLAQLCGYRREVLSLHLSDMQEVLQPEERMRCVEELMVTAVAQVGVDINLAANISWRRDVLAFVPGLGPRKAQALLQAIARNSNKVESRNFMYKEMGYVLGKIVFRNCGAFLRITTGNNLPHLVNMELRQLDDTRIHPENYRLAVAMCTKAIGEEDVETAVDEHKDKIELVDIPQLGEERGAWPSKGPTLIDIHLELLAPFGEVRPASQPLSEEEVFLLQHGETEESLCPGRTVEVRVVFIGKEEVKVRLTQADNIEGVITRRNLSSKEHLVGAGSDLRNCVVKNQILIGRILGLREDHSSKDQTRRFVLDISTKQEDLEMYKWEQMYCKAVEDKYKLPDPEEVKRERALVEREARPTTPSRERSTPSRSSGQAASGLKPLIQRPIKHPLFQNVSVRDASAHLSALDTPVGKCIVRPGESASSLHMSILLHRSLVNPDQPAHILVHYKIYEMGEKTGRTLQLSPPLRVDFSHAGNQEGLEYEDLDELHAGFVEPLLGRVQEYVSHRKFVDAPKPSIDERVRNEFMAAMAQRGAARNVIVPYYLGLDSRSAAFFISFVPPGSKSGTPHHEYMHPTPQGFYFRKKLHHKLEHVITRFKKDPVDPSRRQEVADLGYNAPATIPSNIAAGAAPGDYYAQQAAAAAYYGGYDPAYQGWQGYGWDPSYAAGYADPYAGAAYATGAYAMPAAAVAPAAAPRARTSKWDSAPVAAGVPPPPPMP